MNSQKNNLPIVVLACKVFEHWLEQILPAELAPNITFYDYGLHKVPRNLRQTIQAAIDSIEQPSLIVLGYGLCGNGLDKIQAGKHFLLIPRTDDCIAILLGSYAAYLQEMQREPGTYYLSKGWLEAGSNPLQESQAMEIKYGVEEADWLMDTQYHNYRRLMMVARTPQEMDTYRAQAQEVAEFCARWDMRYEEQIGSDDYLHNLAQAVTRFDASVTDPHSTTEDFLLIPPGGVLKQALFMR